VSCMTSRYARNTIPLVRNRRVCRARHDHGQTRTLADSRPYLGGVAVDREVARVQFAQFVQTAIDAARARGLTAEGITAATGVGFSTWYRWRRGDWGQEWPKLQQVIDFCKGLGIPEEDGFTALGLRGERTPTPAPAPIDPDVLRLLRALADPNVPKGEKDAIRHLLRSLAIQANVAPAAPKPSVRPLRKRREA
jgi:transcriptional regulator with XRE-family HTH domain